MKLRTWQVAESDGRCQPALPPAEVAFGAPERRRMMNIADIGSGGKRALAQPRKLLLSGRFYCSILVAVQLFWTNQIGNGLLEAARATPLQLTRPALALARSAPRRPIPPQSTSVRVERGTCVSYYSRIQLGNSQPGADPNT